MLEIDAPAGVLHYEYDFNAAPIACKMVDTTMDTTWFDDRDAPITVVHEGPKLYLKKVLAGKYETTACRTLFEQGQKLRLSFTTKGLSNSTKDKAPIVSYQDFERTG